MIKVRQIHTEHGEGFIQLDYDHEGKVKTVDLNIADLDQRLRNLKALVNRELRQDDLTDVIRALIDEVRRGEKRIREEFDYTTLIGVDLEVTILGETFLG